ncbi:MAG TPA: hypothetical protein CFH81_08690 [Sulfurovum sp. UBA12169]|nr:MAG TPA: hypothetical protein CFH81_08690 [Sulfurovum sp. UBA12169]
MKEELQQNIDAIVNSVQYLKDVNDLFIKEHVNVALYDILAPMLENIDHCTHNLQAMIRSA